VSIGKTTSKQTSRYPQKSGWNGFKGISPFLQSASHIHPARVMKKNGLAKDQPIHKLYNFMNRLLLHGIFAFSLPGLALFLIPLIST